jgi:DNA-nicking Smr family endonuclease
VLPVTGELDLHAFAPRDVVSVVAEYLDECGRRGIRTVRLAHGRGKGVQRAEIRRLLAGREDVAAFEDEAPAWGGWGATIVRLK